MDIQYILYHAIIFLLFGDSANIAYSLTASCSNNAQWRFARVDYYQSLPCHSRVRFMEKTSVVSYEEARCGSGGVPTHIRKQLL